MGIIFGLVRRAAPDRPEVAVFAISGWLDAQTEARLVEAVRAAKAEGATYAVLDLQHVDMITSAGIRAIQQANQVLATAGASGSAARLKLCNASPRNYEVLSIVGLLQSVPTYESVEIAIAACK